MPARSIGTATISFGLVSIPTKLYTTNEAGGEVHFNMLHDADGARLKQQYICTQCNEIVDREQPFERRPRPVLEEDIAPQLRKPHEPLRDVDDARARDLE